MDDADLARAVKADPHNAPLREELDKRLRFEAAWSGEWTADGGNAPAAMVSSQQRRKAFRELMGLAHSENKATREMARFLLKRHHQHSVP